MCIKDKIFLAQYKHSKYLVLNIDKSKVLEYQIEMINSNKECGIIPIEVKQFNSNLELNYDVMNIKTLEEYINETNIDSQSLINIIKNINNILIKSDDYFLYDYNYLLELDRMYINPVNNVITMVYIPIEEAINDDVENEFKTLIKNIVVNCMSRHWGEENKLGNMIINYIDNNAFDISNFERFLMSIKIDINDREEVKNNHVEDKIENIVQKENYKNIIEKANYSEMQTEKSGESKSILGNILLGIGIFNIIIGISLNILLKVKELKLIGLGVLSLGIVLGIVGFILIMTGKSNKKSNKKVSSKTTSKKSYKNLGTSQLNEIVNKSKKEIITQDAYNTELLVGDENPYLIYKKNNVVEKIEINKSEFLIGRLKEEVDLLIPIQTVGKIHGKFVKDKKGTFLIDMNSKNGTYINGKKLASNKLYRLDSDDEVTFVNNTFIYKES